jgi:hypothetical protein
MTRPERAPRAANFFLRVPRTVRPVHAGGAVKLDRDMMEGVYGRSVSAIEVLRGWEPAPPQFFLLYSALQVFICWCIR